MIRSHEDEMVCNTRWLLAVHINENPWCRLNLFALRHVVPLMELRHGANAAANSVSAVFKQCTTTSLSVAASNLPPLSFISSVHSSGHILLLRHTLYFSHLPRLYTFSVSVVLCSYSSLCSSVSSSHSLSSPLSHVLYRLIMNIQVASLLSFILRVPCCTTVAIGDLNPPAQPIGFTAATHWAGINPGASSLAFEWTRSLKENTPHTTHPHASSQQQWTQKAFLCEV